VLARSGHIKGEDYAHFYLLGRLALEGRTDSLYDAGAQARYLTKAIPGAPETYFVPVYGPQVALLYAPFALLPYLPSLAVFLAASIALYLASCYAIWRTLGSLHRYRIEIGLLALGSPALWQLILHGQNSAIALACVTAGWLCLRSHRPALAGIAFGLLFYKPQLAAAAGVVFLLTGQWTVLLGMVTSAVAQLGCASLILGMPSLTAYTQMLRQLPQIAPLLEPKVHMMHSYRAFFALLSIDARWVLVLSLLCSIATIAVVVRHWKAAVDPDVSFALLLIASVLVSPHTTVYDLVLLAPALLILADRQLRDMTPHYLRWCLLASVFLLPLTSSIASVIFVQPLVVSLTWLLFDQGTQRPSLTPSGAGSFRHEVTSHAQ
jgi:alpha-1,2-mannosyltransferase